MCFLLFMNKITMIYFLNSKNVFHSDIGFTSNVKHSNNLSSVFWFNMKNMLRIKKVENNKNVSLIFCLYFLFQLK